MTRLLFYKFEASNLCQHWPKLQKSLKTYIFTETHTFIPSTQPLPPHCHEVRLLFGDKSHPDWWHEFCHSCSPERCHKSSASNKTFVHLSRWHMEWDKSSEALHFFLLIFLCLTICRIFSLFMGCAESLCAHFFAGFDLFSLLWMCVRWSNWYRTYTASFLSSYT